MKLFIGLPTAGQPTQPFLESLQTLERPDVFTSVERGIVTGNFVPGQRELLIRQALDAKADYLLMIDDDMVLPPATIKQLYTTVSADPKRALVGALYYSRDSKRPMVVSHWSPEDTTSAFIPAFTSDTAVQVDGVGFGCVLLRLAAVQELTQPYCGAQVLIETTQAHVRICNEDYLLCARLRKHGFTIWLDARVRSGHYDRASKQILPHVWEPDSVTGTKRMHVRQADGTESLVPFALGWPHAEELHQTSALDYLFIA